MLHQLVLIRAAAGALLGAGSTERVYSDLISIWVADCGKGGPNV